MKITRELVLQHLHPEAANEYKHIRLEVLPIFLIWGIAYLKIDPRNDHFFQRLLKSEDMKPLMPFIYKYRKGLDPKKLNPTLTLLNFISKDTMNPQNMSLVLSELERFVTNESEGIKLWTLKKWSKHNKISYSRLLLCLCIGAAGFNTTRGERFSPKEHVQSLYREIQKDPANYKKVFHFLANGIERDQWWSEASNYDIEVVNSVDNAYLNIIARESFLHRDTLASMFVGGMRTRLSPKEVKRTQKEKVSKNIPTDYITQFLNFQ